MSVSESSPPQVSKDLALKGPEINNYDMNQKHETSGFHLQEVTQPEPRGVAGYC